MAFRRQAGNVPRATAWQEWWDSHSRVPRQSVIEKHLIPARGRCPLFSTNFVSLLTALRFSK